MAVARGHRTTQPPEVNNHRSVRHRDGQQRRAQPAATRSTHTTALPPKAVSVVKFEDDLYRPIPGGDGITEVR
jgi:hypothetical protein